MTARTILLDGVDSEYALTLTTDLIGVPGHTVLLVGYETQALKFYAPPRVLAATVSKLDLGNKPSGNLTKETYEWLSAKLASDTGLKELVTYLTDFIQDQDNGYGWHVTRLKLYGPTVHGHGLTQVLRRPLANYETDDADYKFEHLFLK